MAGITLETAQKQLDLWIAAEEKVTHGQSYQIGTPSGSVSEKILYTMYW